MRNTFINTIIDHLQDGSASPFKKRILIMASLLSGINRQREERYNRDSAIIEDLIRILVEKYHAKKIVLVGSC